MQQFYCTNIIPNRINRDMSSPIDATVWCLFLHAFFLMFRKSKLVPDTVATFDSKKEHLMKSVMC
jgi:hypothetical protein